MTTTEDIDRIEQRELHIIQLARIVGQEGEPNEGAIPVRIARSNVKCSQECGYPCGHRYDEGDAQWNALERGAWDPVCRLCLPSAIARGEVALDRRSAHESLAFMLGGPSGLDSYRAYFYDDEELAALAAEVEGLPF